MTGEEIKKLRLKLGWSQQRFATELGISIRAEAGWEQGRSLPSSLALQRIQQVAKEHGIALPIKYKKKEVYQ